MTSQPRPLQLSAPENNGHFFWLDWLRFGAAFLVLLCHTRDVTWVDWAELAPGSHTAAAAVLFALSRLGYEAVIIFFVLSGFFVGGKTVHRLLLGTFRLSDYALDRLTRIYLPLLPALLLSAAVGWIVARPISWPDLLGAFFGLQGIFSGIPSTNAPLWSLADEMWFYLALVFLGLAWTSTRWNKILGICGLLFCFAAFARLGFLYFICWSLGAALYFIPHRFFFLTIGFILAGLGLAFRQIASQSVSISLPAWAASLPGETGSTLILALGIGILLPNLGRLAPVSGLLLRVEKTGRSLAAFSYTLYLTHYPLLVLSQFYWPERFTRLDFVSLAGFSGKILICLALAWLLYLSFEAQTSRGRRWLKETFLTLTPKKPLVPAPCSG